MHVILVCIGLVVTDVPSRVIFELNPFGIFVSGVFLTARTVVRSVFKNTKMSNVHFYCKFIGGPRTLSRTTIANLDCAFERNALIFVIPKIERPLAPSWFDLSKAKLAWSIGTPSSVEHRLTDSSKAFNRMLFNFSWCLFVASSIFCWSFSCSSWNKVPK